VDAVSFTGVTQRCHDNTGVFVADSLKLCNSLIDEDAKPEFAAPLSANGSEILTLYSQTTPASLISEQIRYRDK
jgi:hypothetical protein